MHERREYFDVAQANDLIPTLEYYFAEMARIQREVNDVSLKAQKLGVSIDFNGATTDTSNVLKRTLQDRCAELASEYADIIDEVHRMGVIIEDPDMGTVNFFSWVDGDEVVLSWQYGEPEVSHWYRVTEDFMARRKLDTVSAVTSMDPHVH